MTIEGVDFSYGRPGGAALVAAGKHFVVRYVPYTGDGGKGLTAAEIADYRAHDLGIALVFESIAARALSGYSAGYTDAKTSQAALVKLGMPTTLPIYFAVDFDASLAQQAAIDFYLAGAADILGKSRVGVYGGYNVVSRCRVNGSARWFWQTYAWSGGRTASFAHLYQYRNGQYINGAAVDFTRALQANYGQWSGVMPPDTSTGDPMPGFKVTFPPDVKLGKLVLPQGTGAFRLSDGAPYTVPSTVTRDAVTVVHVGGSGGWQVDLNGDEAHFVSPANPQFTPNVVDCTQAVADARAAEHEKVRAAAIAAVEAL